MNCEKNNYIVKWQNDNNVVSTIVTSYQFKKSAVLGWDSNGNLLLRQNSNVKLKTTEKGFFENKSIYVSVLTDNGISHNKLDCGFRKENFNFMTPDMQLLKDRSYSFVLTNEKGWISMGWKCFTLKVTNIFTKTSEQEINFPFGEQNLAEQDYKKRKMEKFDEQVYETASSNTGIPVLQINTIHIPQNLEISENPKSDSNSKQTLEKEKSNNKVSELQNHEGSSDSDEYLGYNFFGSSSDSEG